MSIIAEALKKAQKDSPEKENVEKFASGEHRKTRVKFDLSRLRGYAVFVASFAVFLLLISALPMLGRVLLKGRETEKKSPIERPSYAPKVDRIAQEKTPPEVPLVPVFITLAEVNEAIEVSGIMYTPEKPLVVINDSIWAEGDTVGDFNIVKIEKDFVKVNSNGREFIVKLKR